MENQEANAPIDLPKPVGRPETSPPGRAEKAAPQELAPHHAESASQNAGQPQMPAPAPLLTPNMSNTPAQTGAQQAGSLQTNNPAIADDVDLIEKEWVSKAKEIVARTRQDPYNQNKELTVFRADYMKKRYGKQIELAGD